MKEAIHLKFLEELQKSYDIKKDISVVGSNDDLKAVIDNAQSFLNQYQANKVISYKITGNQLHCKILNKERLRDDLDNLRQWEMMVNRPQPEPATVYEALDEYMQTATQEDLHNLINYFQCDSYHDLRFYFEEGTYFKASNGIKESFSITRNGKKTLLYPFKILLQRSGEWLSFEDFSEAELYSIKSMDDLVIELRKNTFLKLRISDHIRQNSNWLDYNRDNECIRLIPDK